MLISTLTFTQLINFSHASISQNILVKLNSRQPASSSEVDDLKNKLEKLESDLKSKEEIIAIKTKALEELGTDEANLKIDKLNKLLDNQKNQILILEEKIKTAEEKNNNELAKALCQAQLHSSKLEEELKKMLKDKEEVLNEIKLLKEKKDSGIVDSEIKDHKTNDNFKESEVNVALLAQITNLILSQRQAQEQMQSQMYSMMPFQTSNSNVDYSVIGFNPYTYLGLQNTLSFNSNYTGYPGFSSPIGYFGNNFGLGIGISANNHFLNSTNVFNDSISTRTPSSTYPGIDTLPSVRSFDFSQPQNFTPMMQPSFPQLQRGNIL